LGNRFFGEDRSGQEASETDQCGDETHWFESLPNARGAGRVLIDTEYGRETLTTTVNYFTPKCSIKGHDE
jgi:hypothetical protein